LISHVGNNDVSFKNLLHHKKLLNSTSFKLEEAEAENDRCKQKINEYEELINTFFYNCQNSLKSTNLLEKLEHVSTEKNFDCHRISDEFFRHVNMSCISNKIR